MCERRLFCAEMQKKVSDCNLKPLFWWERRDSNPRPSACKADALNQLSYAPETGLQIYGCFLNLQKKYSKVFIIVREMTWKLLYLQS